MDFLKKLKLASSKNGLLLNISGDKKTQIFYGKTLYNPYKIISEGYGSKKGMFENMCSFMIQNYTDVEYSNRLNGYTATFSTDNYKVVIEKNVNGYHTICLYKK